MAGDFAVNVETGSRDGVAAATGERTQVRQAQGAAEALRADSNDAARSEPASRWTRFKNFASRTTHQAVEGVRGLELPDLKISDLTRSVKVPEQLKGLKIPDLNLKETVGALRDMNVMDRLTRVDLRDLRLADTVRDNLPWFRSERSAERTADQPLPQKPGDYNLKMDVDGHTREYKLHLPPQYDGKTKLPVVHFYHFLFSNSDESEEWTRLSQKADKEGFIVVYPNGRPWLPKESVGVELRQWSLYKDGNDLKFAGKLMDTVEQQLAADKGRVYVAGYSNGGMMAHEVAATMPHRVAAMACVSGCQTGKEPAPKEGVSTLLIHGTKDMLVPTEGRQWWTNIGLPEFRSTSFSQNFWRQANGTTESKTEQISPRITREQFVNPRTGNEVVQYTMKDYGHCWPGADTATFGPHCREIDATDIVWDFFKRHEKKR